MNPSSRLSQPGWLAVFVLALAGADPVLPSVAEAGVSVQPTSSGEAPARPRWPSGLPTVRLPPPTPAELAEERRRASLGLMPLSSPLLPPSMPPPPYCPSGTVFPSQLTVYSARMVQTFPDIAWNVCVFNAVKSMWIGPVHMLRPGATSWELVIDQAGLAEIFTPSHDGAVRSHGVGSLGPLDTRHAYPQGLVQHLQNQPLTAPNGSVVSELRDRGVAWLCKQTSAVTRRAQELVVWSHSDRGYEDTIVEFSFRDDGAIVFRAGHGGYNDPADTTEPHIHNALWYLRPGGPRSAYWLSHVEPVAPSTPHVAQDSRTAITVEGARHWNEREFASLLLESGVVNAFGNMRGYEISPLPNNALSRHFGPDEMWTQSDVYLTRARFAEMNWITQTGTTPDSYLLTYLNGEPIVNEDLALWVRVAVHHRPTDEDRAGSWAGPGMRGVTLLRWGGFKMEPHNLFDANPLGGPARCGP